MSQVVSAVSCLTLQGRTDLEFPLNHGDVLTLVSLLPLYFPQTNYFATLNIIAHKNIPVQLKK